MSVSICPIAIVNTPTERVWKFLSEPGNYALWWDAETYSIVPEDHARLGQQIHAQATELSRQWNVNITVEMVDEARHQIDLNTRLPFGITVHNHITCIPIDNTSCRVSFG